MDTRATVASLAMQRLRQLGVWFPATLGTGSALLWLPHVLAEQGPANIFVVLVAYATGAGLLLCAYYAGFALVLWFVRYDAALRDADAYGRDPQAFAFTYSEVVEPVPLCRPMRFKRAGAA